MLLSLDFRFSEAFQFFSLGQLFVFFPVFTFYFLPVFFYGRLPQLLKDFQLVDSHCLFKNFILYTS